MGEHDPKSYEAAQGKINTLYAALTLSNEANRRLEAKVEDLRRGLDDMTGMYRVACENRAAAYAKVEELEGLCAITGIIEREKKYIAAEAKVEQLKAELRTEIAYHAGTDSHYRARRMRAALQEGE